MARPPAERLARIAVVGAGSDAGARLRAELAARGVPGERVALYGVRRGESVVSEYDGEARLLQEPDIEAIAVYDVIFACEADATITALAGNAGAADRLLDLTGSLGAALAHEPLRPPAAAGPVGVPHSLSIVLVEILSPLRALGLSRVTVTILRPASDFGEAGLEELREQTLRLLRFESPPTGVLGRQLAFNLIPQALLPEGAGLERRLAAEVGALLGPSGPEISVSAVAVPVFHGHGLTLRVEGTGARAASCRAALGEAGIVVAKDRAAATTMDAPDTRRIDVAVIEDDGAGAVRLWAVVAEAGSSAARQALALAARRAAF